MKFLTVQDVSAAVGSYTYTAFSSDPQMIVPGYPPPTGRPVFAVPTFDGAVGLSHYVGSIPGQPWYLETRNGGASAVYQGVPVPNLEVLK